MTNKLKGFLALLLALVMCIGLASPTALAVGNKAAAVLTCEKELHAHSIKDGCYALACGTDERDAVAGHQHSDGCYEGEQTICQLEETADDPGHAHTDGCYAVACEKEEHSAHGDDCYTYYETLQKAVNNAGSGAVVTLLTGVTENITISGKTLTLDLNGHEINGGQKGTVIIINSGSKVTLTGNGVITGGKTGPYQWGGGVFVNEGAEVIMESGTITRNYSGEYGGGVCVRNGAFEMCGGAITDNEAAVNGGGVYVYNYFNDKDHFAMTGGTISGNKAGAQGGGIFAYGFKGTDKQLVSLTGGAVMNNSTGTGNGGGVYVAFATATITGCTVSGNSAAGASGSGGGVFLYGAPAAISGCTFDANTTAKHGGGVYVTSATVTVSDCVFTGNTTAESGGGLHLSGAGAQISGCEFTGNKAATNGAGLDMFNGTKVDVANTTFAKNTAGNAGGGVCANPANTLTMTSVTVSENKAVWGGGIYSSDTVLSVTGGANGSNITGNSATDPKQSAQGGGIFVMGGSVTLKDGVTVSDNRAIGNGGGVLVWKTTADISANIHHNAVTAGNGGGIYIGESAATVKKSTVKDNSALYDGGGMFVWNSDGVSRTATITDCVLTGNSAGAGGGVIVGGTTKATVEGCTVTDNTAGFGGGVCNWLAATTVNGGSITGNKATNGTDKWNGGGAVFSNNGSVQLSGNVTVTGNEAATNGSGIFACGKSAVDAQGSVLHSNVKDDAYRCGGASIALPGEDPGNGEHITTDDVWQYKKLDSVDATDRFLAKPRYTVTYVDEQGNTIKTERVTRDDGLPVDAPEAQKGKNFIGWFDGKDEQVNGEQPVTDDVTVVVRFTYNVTVDGDTYAEVGFNTPVSSLERPEAPAGKEFDGWLDENGNPVDGDTLIQDVIALVPNWKNTPVAGGYVPPANQPVVDGAPVESKQPDSATLEDSDVPLGEAPDMDIDDLDVPLAGMPDVNIDEPDVPLADVPQTGDSSGIWSAVALMSGVCMACLALKNKKRESDAQ